MYLLDGAASTIGVSLRKELHYIKVYVGEVLGIYNYERNTIKTKAFPIK